MPEPYYATESGNNCTQKLSDSPQNPEAPNEAISYVLLFFLWYWALACSDSTIDALITQRSKLEPDEKRGTLISCARISRQLGSMFAYLAVGILFNTVNYGGSFCGFDFKFNHFTWILFVFTIVGLIYALMFTNEKDIDKEKEKIEVKRKLAELWSLFHKWYYLKLLIFAVYISLISSIRVSKAKKQKLLKSGADLGGGGGTPSQVFDPLPTHSELWPIGYTLLVTLSYFRPDRFVQLLSLIPILILLLYLLVSIDLVYTGYAS